MLEDHIASQIRKLEDKYKHSGQDLSAYLDGLLYQRYLTYWDYIHLDTLLSLQVPKTHFPDEEIFIVRRASRPPRHREGSRHRRCAAGLPGSACLCRTGLRRRRDGIRDGDRVFVGHRIRSTAEPRALYGRADRR